MMGVLKKSGIHDPLRRFCVIDAEEQLNVGFEGPPSDGVVHHRLAPAAGARGSHRTVRSKGCLSNKTALAMVFKLAQAAQNSWRRLDGHNQLPKLIVGVKFVDGIEAVRQQPQAPA